MKTDKSRKSDKSGGFTDHRDCFDPFGSYTGTPEGGGEPIQDVDDL